MASDFKFAKNTVYNGELVKAGTVRKLLDGVAKDLEKRGFGSIVTPAAAPKTDEKPVLQSTATEADEKPPKTKNKRPK